MTSNEHDKRRNLEGRHLGRRIARCIVALLVQAIVLQPAAFAANWNVAQQPLFTINPVYPNAVFMIDDSWSMNDYRLPPPPFFSVNNRWPAPGNVTVKYGAGTRTVAAHNEFTLRSSIHNPLAYDPSITYTPWNDNDKPLAAQGTRPNARRELSAGGHRWHRRASRPRVDSPNATCASGDSRTTTRMRCATGSRHREGRSVTRPGRRATTGRPARRRIAGPGTTSTSATSSRSRTRSAWRSTTRCRVTDPRRRISSRTRRRSAMRSRPASSGIRFSRTSACKR